MALARIRTHFPEEVTELCEALIEAGYVVETVRPGEFHIAPADLELTVDKLPVVEAWRHIPKADEVYVAPDTPESRDIRSAIGAQISHGPLLARFVVETGERYTDFTKWLALQARELRARIHDIRQKWTPPREYHAEVHLDPAVPSGLVEARIDEGIEHVRLEVVSRNEEVQRRQEEEHRRLLEQARMVEETRQRAREAAEAKALLEEQRKIEAMVRASEELRQRVLNANLPPRQEAPRKRPRRLLRTRRERAFFRAGVAAFALSMGLAMLAAEALHPQPASSTIPQKNARANTIPFESKTGTTNAANTVPMPATIISPATNASLKSAEVKPSAIRPVSAQDDADEVIVRRVAPPRRPPARQKDAVIHYSDLD